MDVNYKYYETPKIAEGYACNNTLQKPEAFIFSILKDKLLGATLLDIGVGAGRTTFHLLDKCEEYIGIDYSPRMLAQCKIKFPHANLELGDARSLNFSDAKFDIILCSYNAIDDVNHQDRLLILKEVHRVLKKGGIFIFSSHNPNSKLKSAASIHNFKWKQNL